MCVVLCLMLLKFCVSSALSWFLCFLVPSWFSGDSWSYMAHPLVPRFSPQHFLWFIGSLPPVFTPTLGMDMELWKAEVSAGWTLADSLVSIKSPHQPPTDVLWSFGALGSVKILFIAPSNALIGHTSRSVRSIDMKSWHVCVLHSEFPSISHFSEFWIIWKEQFSSLNKKKKHTAQHYTLFAGRVGVFLFFICGSWMKRLLVSVDDWMGSIDLVVLVVLLLVVTWKRQMWVPGVTWRSPPGRMQLQLQTFSQNKDVMWSFEVHDGDVC